MSKFSIILVVSVTVSRNFWPSKVQYIFGSLSDIKSSETPKYRESRKAENVRQTHGLNFTPDERLATVVGNEGKEVDGLKIMSYLKDHFVFSKKS